MSGLRSCGRFMRSNNFKLIVGSKNYSTDKSKSVDRLLPEDVETHTGQKWDRDDYRMVRFIDRPKHVNTSYAVDLIASVPPEPKKERVVWCDGGDEATGHPRVYINLDKPGNHSCGYCGLRFYKEDDHNHS